MSMDTKAVLSQERIGELYRQSFSAMMGRLREPLKQYVPDTAIAFARAIEQEVIASLRAALAEGEVEPNTSTSNTMAGFRGGFLALHGRAPTEQEIWNAGVDSGRRRFGTSCQTEAEPVAWYTDDHETDRSATTYSREVVERWLAKGWPVTPLFRHPSPAALRAAVIEECAKVCEKVAVERMELRIDEGKDAAFRCSNLVRALKEKA